jgi:membrane protein
MAKKSTRWEKTRKSLVALWDEKFFRPEAEWSSLYKFIHFWVLVWRSFVRNRCPVHASALSFGSLLALIPMLALAMSVTTSLLKKEGADQIEKFIQHVVDNLIPAAPMASPDSITNDVSGVESLPTVKSDVSTNSEGTALSTGMTNQVIGGATAQPAITNAFVVRDNRVSQAQKEAARSIKQFIENTSSATLGVTGMIFLVFVAISMLIRIEETFNDIWGVTRGRSLPVRVVVYWATITLGPIFLAGALALASGPHFQSTQKLLTTMPVIGSLTFKVVPLLVLWIAFTAFYKAVPNTKVRFTAALVGGIVGGTAWHVNNLFGFLYVSRVVTNNKIYGSLGLVPVFMAGIYLSWWIMLFGAQVAYAFQNRSLYLQEKLAENVNQRGREFVALRLMTCLGQRFQRGLRPATIQEMSTELGVPSRLVQQVLQTLLAARLVIEVSGTEPAYTPARPLESINAHHVLMAMRAVQGQELVTREEPVRAEVYGEFARIQEAEKQVASTISLLTLVNRAQALLELAPPADAEDDLKMTHAFVPPSPKIISAVQPVSQPHHEMQNLAQPPDAPTPTAVAPKTEHSVEPAAVRPIAEPSTDEERDFPL